MDGEAKILMLNPKRVLCIEAHPDDFLIGCGGTLARLKRENPKVSIWSTYFCPCTEDPQNNGNLNEHAKSSAYLGVENILPHQFPRNNYLESNKQDLRDAIFAIKEKYDPDLVFTHSINDWHQDHNIIAETSLNVFRNSALILSYESPSVSPKFQFQTYIQLTDDDVKRKIDALNMWESQLKARPYFFKEELFISKLKCHGSPIRSDWAEVFEVVGKI